MPRFRFLLAEAHYNISRVHGLRGKFALAIDEQKKALLIFEILHEDFPENPHAFALAQAHLNLGYYQQESAAFADAFRSLEAAHRVALPLVEDATFAGRAKSLLRDTHWTRAQIHVAEKRIAESLKAFDEALRWDDGSQGKEIRAERDKAAKSSK